MADRNYIVTNPTENNVTFKIYFKQQDLGLTSPIEIDEEIDRVEVRDDDTFEQMLTVDPQDSNVWQDIGTGIMIEAQVRSPKNTMTYNSIGPNVTAIIALCPPIEINSTNGDSKEPNPVSSPVTDTLVVSEDGSTHSIKIDGMDYDSISVLAVESSS